MSIISHAPDMCRRRILVRGIVQGVGFRPFVHNLAHALDLRGFVRNSAGCVIIEAEGSGAAVDRLVDAIHWGSPPLAQIDEISVFDLVPRQTPAFTIDESIDESVPDESALGQISPDVALCADCRRELHDTADRRYGYPFINCTHCGPRYSITRGLPYDRPATTMSVFPMCDSCLSEYGDAGDRRFHAQPNACPECGPGLALVSDWGDTPSFDARNAAAVIARLQALLAGGAVVAMRSVGGFHLACDATNEKAVTRLRAMKHRGGKPFAVMARDLAAAERLCIVADADRALLCGIEQPVVIMKRRSEIAPAPTVAPSVAPNCRTLGVMLPYSPLHELLFRDAPFNCLVMTSGNRSEEPIVTANGDAVRQFAGLADALLLHDRDIHLRVDDSVVRTFEGRSCVLRRSRGYAPRAIDLGEPVAQILACGAELKNTFCLTRDHHAIVSQHIGDLSNYESLQFFEETLAHLKTLFRIEPRVVAHDLHPNYSSTRYARALNGVQHVAVQHHHAHIASCMADNGIRGRVIGVAMDGTGYGSDGAVWGGEFLVADLRGFERRAHLRYVPLAGGDAAVRQPWRSALSYLRDSGAGEEARGLPLFAAVSPRSAALVETMLSRGLNTIPTSSCGRLFDAVASIAGVRHEITFEAQAAIDLEMLAGEWLAGGSNDEAEAYPFAIVTGDPLQIDVRPMIAEIVDDVLRGTPGGGIASRFHITMAAITADVCERIRRRDGLNRVCLSGGVFQNFVLLERTARALRRSGFELFLHSRVPPNDGGISLGQAVIANERIQGG